MRDVARGQQRTVAICSSATANSLCGLSGLNHLILELLNRAGAEANHLADLADADAGRQELPSFLELVRLRTGTAKALNRGPSSNGTILKSQASALKRASQKMLEQFLIDQAH